MFLHSLTHHHCYVVPLGLLDGPAPPEDELVGGQEGLQIARVEGERAPGGGHATVAELEVKRGEMLNRIIIRFVGKQKSNAKNKDDSVLLC